MTPEHCARTFDELWPGSDWTDTIGREFWRRVQRMPLTDEQVEAVMTEYRMTTRYKSPVPSDLLRRLQVAAAGPKADRKIDNEYQPTPLSGRAVTYQEWAAWARSNGIRNHLGRYLA